LFAITAEKHFGLGNMEEEVIRCRLCGRELETYEEQKRGVCRFCQCWLP